MKRILQLAEVIGVVGELADIFGDGEDGSAIVFAKHLMHEAKRGILFEENFFVGAEAGIHH